MKRLLIIALMLGSCIYAQNSDYNKNIKLTASEDISWGQWFREPDGSEIILYEQNPAGYYTTTVKLKEIVAFYGLENSNIINDETLIGKDIDAKDYTSMSNSLLIGTSFICKKWETDAVILVVICDTSTNGILLTQKNRCAR